MNVCQFLLNLELSHAKWGVVVEWIEHPLLMLEVRSSNPATPSQNIPLLYPKPSGSSEPEGAYPVMGVTLGPDQKKVHTGVIIESLKMTVSGMETISTS